MKSQIKIKTNKVTNILIELNNSHNSLINSLSNKIIIKNKNRIQIFHMKIPKDKINNNNWIINIMINKIKLLKKASFKKQSLLKVLNISNHKILKFNIIKTQTNPPQSILINLTKMISMKNPSNPINKT